MYVYEPILIHAADISVFVVILMYNHICIDFLSGLLLSLRFGLFKRHLQTDAKLRRLALKILKYNVLFHCIPVTCYYLCSLLGWEPVWILTATCMVLNCISGIFHLLHFMDLLNIVSTYGRKTSNTGGALKLLSFAVTMSLYQFVIYLTILLLDLLNYDRLYVPVILIKFGILALYHSFYCYNNLWQYKKIEMHYRIDMHEKLWPFYLGYGTVASILYLHTSCPYVLAAYNVYMAVLVALPFLSEPRYPSRHHTLYPSINLTIFSHITDSIFALTRIVCHAITD